MCFSCTIRVSYFGFSVFFSLSSLPFSLFLNCVSHSRWFSHFLLILFIYSFICVCIYLFAYLFINVCVCIYHLFIYSIIHLSVYIFFICFPPSFLFFPLKKLKTFPFYFPVHVNIKVSFIHLFCFYSKCLYQLRQEPVCVVVCK